MQWQQILAIWAAIRNRYKYELIEAAIIFTLCGNVYAAIKLAPLLFN